MVWFRSCDKNTAKYSQWGVDETKANPTAGLDTLSVGIVSLWHLWKHFQVRCIRYCKQWVQFCTSYVKTKETGKWSVHHFASSKELIQQFVHLYRQSSLLWWKKNGGMTFHSQDLRGDRQTDTQSKCINYIDADFQCNRLLHPYFTLICYIGINVQYWPVACQTQEGM